MYARNISKCFWLVVEPNDLKNMLVRLDHFPQVKKKVFEKKSPGNVYSSTFPLRLCEEESKSYLHQTPFIRISVGGAMFSATNWGFQLHRSWCSQGHQMDLMQWPPVESPNLWEYWPSSQPGPTTLPKTNISHLKIDPWKRRFLLETTIFRCYVSLRECNYKWVLQPL